VKASMYKLDSSFAQGHFTVTIVGCGGTGSFAAEGLCRLLPPRADLVLIDHDRVEERNLTRQNFIRGDLGLFKSEALAKRLAREYGSPVAYSTLALGMVEVRYPGLIIGCVDNGPARRQIAQIVNQGSLTYVGGYSRSVPRELQRGPRLEAYLWWVDAGNGENYGQILIGNTDRGIAFDTEKDVWHALPLPTLQRPEILAQAPPREQGCVQIAEQGPTINQAMATLVVEVVRRLIEGSCPWMQLYLDLEAGTLNPVLATPEVVANIAGIKNKKFAAERR
jgi:hypothetical protein